ncbi:DUF6600 domain-containing protein [Sorangium atrum]|uniref:Secreted protein n=1 Tax=Sorangium atrum TaxID=2995308 RepID=A0ABT5CCW3_9BACT|nr:DUF6600 domain-containing protein [Sorangium aterium]MDC0683624.1 hypothetical protein [Sorangium aterium]
MLPMPLPLSASPSRPAPAAPGIPGARLRRLGGALPLLAALIAAPASAAAQPAEAAPVQVDVRVSAQAQIDADEYEDTDPSALVEFQQPLAAYGTWVDDPSYGTVWVPSAVVVGADFAPYQTAGHWALTDDGEWLWVSDYTWGHIPFHYGRWVWISSHGWAWIPGRTYAPAWVVWRVGDAGYVGWAPMPPTYTWSSGVAVSLWTVPPAAYVFCPTTHVFHRHVHTHVIRDREVVRRIAAHSHTYRPARPTASRPGRADIRPGGDGGAGRSSPSHGIRPGGYRPASPSLAEAGVPSSAAPRHRDRPDPRALAYARRSTTPSARHAAPPARRPASPAGDDRRAAPALRTPLHPRGTPDGDAPAPVARPGLPARGVSDAGALHRSGASPSHRPWRPAVTPASPLPAPETPASPAPRPVGTPAATRDLPHRSPSATAPRPLPQATQAPQPIAKPRALPSAPSSPPRPRIHLPSGPAPGKTAPASGRPRSR